MSKMVRSCKLYLSTALVISALEREDVMRHLRISFANASLSRALSRVVVINSHKDLQVKEYSNISIKFIIHYGIRVYKFR